MVSDSVILKKIEGQPRHAAGFKQLVRELGVRGDERKQLLSRLERLVSADSFCRLAAGGMRFLRLPAGKNMVIGKLSMHRDGYGFVTPDPSAMDERMKARLVRGCFYSSSCCGIGDAWGPCGGGGRVRFVLMARLRGVYSDGQSSASYGCGNFSLRAAGELCYAD